MGDNMGYGPHLTNKQRARLEAEIREFDKAKTLRAIERNAVGKPDVNAYVEFDVPESYSANPDQLEAPDNVEMMTGIDWQMLEAKMEINEILSFRQKQVWQLCMRYGKSVKEASEQLNLKVSTVASYLKIAKEKVKEHFNGK